MSDIRRRIERNQGIGHRRQNSGEPSRAVDEAEKAALRSALAETKKADVPLWKRILFIRLWREPSRERSEENAQDFGVGCVGFIAGAVGTWCAFIVAGQFFGWDDSHLGAAIVSALVGGWLGGWLCASGAATARRNSLPARFKRLGDVRGKTKEEIIRVVGPARSWSLVGDGRELMQWMENTNGYAYHISLIFTNGLCDGITHEYAG
jgi:hypothetical protein